MPAEDRPGSVAILDRAGFSQVLEGVLQSRGTLRVLLAALGTGPPSIIHGRVFREVLEQYHLRQTFQEALQNALVLEKLDALWCGRQDDGAVVEFRFPEEQTIPQESPVGRIFIELKPVVRFTVSPEGSVSLQSGDITLRWLLMREDLGIQMRHEQTEEGPGEDWLVLSAGSILTRRFPLRELAPELVPAIAAPPLAPPEEVEEEPLPAPEMVLVVVHVLRGRVRYRIDALYRNEALQQRLERDLRSLPGVRRVAAKPLTGSLVVTFDANVTLDELESWVVRIVSGREIVAVSDVAADHPPWHLMPLAEVVAYWESSLEGGLDRDVIEARRQLYGHNRLPEPEARSKLSILLDQFKSLPVALLGVSAALSVLTGGLADGIIILGVVMLNAGIGYATENWAEETIASLNRGAEPEAIVVREGAELVVAGAALVPGDLITLRRGTMVPADARLVAADDLTIDESTLTGESVPVRKEPRRLTDAQTPLANRVNMVYRGTIVSGGSGQALVVTTGSSTEVGQIQRMLAEATPPETPLQRQLRVLGGQLVFVTLGACGGVLALGLLRGQGFLPMLKIAVSLAVAAVPEGLPTVATTTLALGVRRLQQQNVLVRRLSVVETLGGLEYVCLDKTGTITLNRMTLVAAHVNGHTLRHEDGEFRANGDPLDDAGRAALQALLKYALLCSEVELDESNGEAQLLGSATETALAQAALDAGMDLAALRQVHPVKRLRLRTESRIYMDTLHRTSEGEGLVAIKGQPGQVLELCQYQWRDGEAQPLSEAERVRISVENERMAGKALRVLGVAYGRGDKVPEEARDLVWVGLAGIADPPRPEMKELIARLHRAGIHAAMITGDQSATASAVAKQIGLGEDGNLQTLDSMRLEQLEPDVLRSLSQQVDVFSRVSPAHKLQIVQALQRSGHVVAMTGDGVNDGPALRAADIGIAMGQAGSEVARDVADIIIYDDDLATLIMAIEQGRTIYDDIRKAVHFIVSSNTSEILITLVATTAGMGEVLGPMQLLWINLVTDIFPELALGVEPPETDVMQRRPRDPQAPMFTPSDFRRIALEGGLLTGATMSAYVWGLSRYGFGPRASTLAFSSLTTGQLLHAISSRSEPHSFFDPTPYPRNPYMMAAVGGGLILQGAATMLPGLRSILGATPLGFLDWLVAGASAVGPFVINELLKIMRRLPPPPDNEEG